MEDFSSLALALGLVGSCLLALIICIDNAFPSTFDRTGSAAYTAFAEANSGESPMLSAGYATYTWTYLTGWGLIVADLIIANGLATSTNEAFVLRWAGPLVSVFMIIVPQFVVGLESMRSPETRVYDANVFALYVLMHLVGFLSFAYLAQWRRSGVNVAFPLIAALVGAMTGAVEMGSRYATRLKGYGVCIALPFSLCCAGLAVIAAIEPKA